MAVVVPRGKFVEVNGRQHLGSSLSQSFVCAVCGARLIHSIDGRGDDVYTCAVDPEHNTIIPEGLYDRNQHDFLVEQFEIQSRRKQELIEAAKEMFPEIADTLDEKLQDTADMLFPKDHEGEI